MAYDNNTCHSLTIKGIRCFYDLTWTSQLMGNIRYLTRNQNPGFMHLVMMGRMITTTVLLCEGHNVFLTDSDVLFYRDPMPYIFPEVNFMITATPISQEQDSWGGPFFSEQPMQFYTLNNGVVFYRSNPVTRSFTMTLVAHCMNSFKGRYDHEEGFLQKVFNRMLIDGKLSLHTCRKVSDPTTFQLNSSHLNNTVGECYDCYFGHIPWWSDVVQLPVVPNHPHVLKIGVFPTYRYTSMCYAPDQAVFTKSLIEAASALNHSDNSHWGWGELQNNKSRVLLVHGNCVDEGAMGQARYKKKIDWFKSVGSWFLDA
eukprot:gene7602-9104_t